MNCKNALLAVALAVALSFAFAGVADDTDAASDIGFGKLIEVHDFDDMGKGSITVYLNNGTSNEATVTVKVFEGSSDNVLTKAVTTLPADDTEHTHYNQAVDLSFGYQSQGHKYITVAIYDESDHLLVSQGGIEIDVDHNLWKDSMTYILIIAVIVIIVVIAYLYMRNAPKREAKKMSDTTFTDLHNQKQKSKSEKKASGPSKYKGKKN